MEGDASFSRRRARRYDWPFAVLLFLFMYIFSLLGMQFFANRLRFDDALQPADGLGWFASSPQRLNLTRSVGDHDRLRRHHRRELERRHVRCWRGTGWSAALYFMLLIMLGIFLLMNLFLAILLNNFGNLDDGKEGEGESLIEVLEENAEAQHEKEREEAEKERAAERAADALAADDSKEPPTNLSAGDAATAGLAAQIASAESAVRSGELTHAAGALEEAVEEVAAAPKDCVSRLLLGCRRRPAARDAGRRRRVHVESAAGRRTAAS